jgi:putative membrane protein
MVMIRFVLSLSSKLALERSRSRAVEDFADRMVDDHRAAAIRLKEALARAKREMPPEKLDARQQAILDDLKARDAQSFDKAYIEAQYRAHLATANLFRTYATAGDDARIKQFAQELLLMVRAHLDQASRLRGADKAS